MLSNWKTVKGMSGWAEDKESRKDVRIASLF